MKKTRKMLLAGGVAVALMVPATAALAASEDGTPNPDRVCTGSYEMDRDRLRDGTGWRHTLPDGSTMQIEPGTGYLHHRGPEDGTGPQADRALDGTGHQWRAGNQ